MAVRAHPDHLGTDGLKVRELLTEVPPLAGLQLRQSIVHEDQDGELANELLRGDVDKLEALPGLVDADHRKGAEDLHHRTALAWMTFPFRRRKGGAWCSELLGSLRLERSHACVCSAGRFR